MRRLLRLIAIVVAGTLVIAGATTAVDVVGHGFLHDTASAAELPLPPLDTPTRSASTVYASDGTTVLAVLHASQNRKPVALSKVSKLLITAVLDTEDHRFYLHGGIDVRSALRALVTDSARGAGLQGGSTITQQLVKQTYLTSVRTVGRKVKEAVLAERLLQHYTKDQILQAYLNTVYLGNGAYGVEAAANEYFGVHASQVTLPEAALLAGLIQNPSGYDPIFAPAAARSRRSEVLGRMVHYGDITRAQADAADATPLPTAVTTVPVAADQISDYYVQEVEDELLGPNSPLGANYAERYQALFEGGLRIYTNLDPRLQALAEQRVAADSPANPYGFEEAMVTIDPANGHVVAMVGGTGFSTSKFDVITQGTRQPGSGFKLFTLLSLLQQGYSVYDTVDTFSPCAVVFPGDNSLLKTPIHNDSGDGGGATTVINATAQSINCAYIRLAHEVGLQNVAAIAAQLGVTEKLDVVPSMVIGADAVHPIEIAGAYAAVADGGVFHQPTFINRVVDRSGSTIYTGTAKGHRVVSTQVAEEAEVALQAVVTSGTGTGAALPGRPAAGKTGTTEREADAWFNGFTPQLETTVWMGSLKGEVPMRIGGVAVYGASYPAHTWQDFMTQALAPDPVVPFSAPDPAILPATEYITSPALVLDDTSNHNAAGPPPGSNVYSSPSTGSGSGAGGPLLPSTGAGGGA